MRYWAIPILSAATAAASAEETTVWLSILGRGGAEEVEIGPEGGLVPYRLAAQTDPIGTPGNHGLWSVFITIDTDTGVEQQPVAMFDPTVDVLFVSVWPSVNRYGPFVSKGQPVSPDDLRGVAVAPGCSRDRRAQSMCRGPTGTGQAGPQPVARGYIRVPAARAGSDFRAVILLDMTAPSMQSGALIIQQPELIIVPPDRTSGNALTIHVVEHPRVAGDLDGDGDVDLADFLSTMECFVGPGRTVSGECEFADFDWDGDVDLADVIALMGAYTGAN